MKLKRIMLSSHQGLGLLIGIQVVIWVTGGFVMSVLPIEKVRGEDWVAEQTPVAISADVRLVAPNQIAPSHPFEKAELAVWLDRPVYRLTAGESTTMADAVTGELLSPISADLAADVAKHDYVGPGTIASVTRQTEPLLEIRGRQLPLWRVDFDDSRHTTVYVSPQSGQVVGRRNAIWRVYDFFWMLHIMDYSQRENFNHPWLIAAAVIAWLLATTGMYLVVASFKRTRRRKSSV